jgi:diaminobutyrate-2-oxoglutarate transaminase
VIQGAKGRGMMRGLDVGSAEVSSAIVQAAFARGHVIETSGPSDEIVKVLAPLTIAVEDLDRGLDILSAAIAQTQSAAPAAAA